MAENDGAQMHSILLEEREKLRVTGVSPLRIFYFPSKWALTATLRPRNPLFSPVID